MSPVLRGFSWRKAQMLSLCTLYCCINMAYHEKLLRLSPRCSNFVSFVQHIFITICGCTLYRFPFENNRPVPILYYTPLVMLNFLMILTNNISYNYGISIPLNMIFKSSSLIANMLMGIVFLRHRYTLSKYLSVLLITAGLIVCTLEDYRVRHSIDFEQLLFEPNTGSVRKTTIGIGFLTASLLLSAAIGIYQEFLSKSFGKFPQQMLFYVHFLALPIFFLTSGEEIVEHGKVFSESAAWLVGNGWQFGASEAKPLVYLIAIVLCQYLCTRKVFELTTECTSLTVTLCLTNRKFLSLVFSIFYLGNLFTLYHWAGSLCVFFGVLLFAFTGLRKSKTN